MIKESCNLIRRDCIFAYNVEILCIKLKGKQFSLLKNSLIFHSKLFLI